MLCPSCNSDVETLEHFLIFLIRCDQYNIIKNSFVFWNGAQTENEDDLIAKILMLDGEMDELQDKKNLLQQMWKQRGEAQRRREMGEQ